MKRLCNCHWLKIPNLTPKKVSHAHPKKPKLRKKTILLNRVIHSLGKGSSQASSSIWKEKKRNSKSGKKKTILRTMIWARSLSLRLYWRKYRHLSVLNKLIRTLFYTHRDLRRSIRRIIQNSLLTQKQDQYSMQSEARQN